MYIKQDESLFQCSDWCRACEVRIEILTWILPGADECCTILAVEICKQKDEVQFRLMEEEAKDDGWMIGDNN